MLTFPLGVARMDRIRNEHIRGTAQMGQFSDKVREERAEVVWAYLYKEGIWGT